MYKIAIILVITFFTKTSNGQDDYAAKRERMVNKQGILLIQLHLEP
jgi:hypothetical protein